ncbi:MAG: hypothetical protein LBI72_06560 [Flavobacteriaceae bacterium]|nr:hypothetical protein [Flavobacteriaceae bacterium]
MKTIFKELENYFNQAPIDVQKVLIIPDITHPHWEDNKEIITLAKEQILDPIGLLLDEFILASVGVHVKLPLIGKRNSVGFLLTNQRIFIQSDVTFTKRDIPPVVIQLTQEQNEIELGKTVWNDFATKNTVVTDEEQLKGMEEALKEVIKIALSVLQEKGSLPKEILQASDCKGRIIDLNLYGVMKSFEEDKKRLNNFAEKHNISNILYGIVDKPLFGAVYGLVLTPTGVSSRDLMEKCISSTWEQIAETNACKGKEEAVLMIGSKKHIIPTYQKAHLNSIIELINGIAQGKVIL